MKWNKQTPKPWDASDEQIVQKWQSNISDEDKEKMLEFYEHIIACKICYPKPKQGWTGTMRPTDVAVMSVSETHDRMHNWINDMCSVGKDMARDIFPFYAG